MPQEYHSEQDWTPVVFSKTPTKMSKTTAARIGALETIKKTQPINTQANKIEKLADSEDGKLVIKTVSKEIGQLVAKTRVNLKLTQKDLAVKSQVLEADIKQLEQGTLKYNAQTLQKLQRCLKIKLLGDNIGTPI